jgi:hypothetical protein
MPIDTNATLQMTPVDTGDMSEIPPDLPAGEWDGTIEVKASKTSKDSYPMLIIELTTTQAYGDGGENYVGARATEFCTFFPETHKASKMSKLRVKALCEAAGLDLPDTSSLAEGSFSSLEPFVDALESNQIHFWTTTEADKKTGEVRTRIHFTQPGAKLGSIPAAAAEPELEEVAPPKSAARVLPKATAAKTNGTNGHSTKPKHKR